MTDPNGSGRVVANFSQTIYSNHDENGNPRRFTVYYRMDAAGFPEPFKLEEGYETSASRGTLPAVFVDPVELDGLRSRISL